MKRAFVLLLAILASACVGPLQDGTRAARADDFSFVFKDYSCAAVPVNILDTAAGTLIYIPLGEITSITIPLQLSDEELDAIFQKATAIGFFNYPSRFAVPDDEVRGVFTPASRYELRMTNGAETHSVAWTDDKITDPAYKDADQLRELMDLIDQTIRSHPEFRQLPEPKAGCL